MRRVLVWVLCAAGCPSSPIVPEETTSPTEAPEPAGSLAVVIDAPLDVVVDIVGPGGFAEQLTGSATLSGLAPGSYEAIPQTARRAGAGVDELYDAPRASATVEDGATAPLGVAYTLRPGTGHLWFPRWSDGQVSGFDADQLATGGDGITPALSVGLADGAAPNVAAFDRDGGLWLGLTDGRIVGIAREDLAVPQPPLAKDFVALGDAVVGLLFTPSGDLWALSPGGLERYPASDLALDPIPDPNAVLSVNEAGGLAFDLDGRLWITDGAGAVRAYDPEKPGEPLAELVGKTLESVRGIAFDADGGMWLAIQDTGAIVRYAPDQLDLPAGPPDVTLTGVAPLPQRLAFDGNGDLWVSAMYGPGFAGFGFLGRIAAADLAQSGSPPLAASLFNVGSIDGGGAMALNPTPAGLPLVGGAL
jgi:streptogramin lyase